MNAYDTPHKRRRVGSGSVKGQKAWYRQKERTALAKAGQLSPSSGSAKRFLAKVRAIDENAEVSRNGLEVRCSACATWAIMRTPYELRRFTEHRQSKTCLKARKKKTFRPSLSLFGFATVPQAAPGPSDPLVLVPCPGLLRTTYENVDRYLMRSATSGGGARSRLVLAMLLFEKPWVELTGKESSVVLRRVAQEYRWINQHALGTVYAASCEKNTRQHRSKVGVEEAGACDACLRVLHLRAFQTATNRPIPSDAMMKHVPTLYRSEKLGEIYAKHKGVRDLVEAVCSIYPLQPLSEMLTSDPSMIQEVRGLGLPRVHSADASRSSTHSSALLKPW